MNISEFDITNNDERRNKDEKGKLILESGMQQYPPLPLKYRNHLFPLQCRDSCIS